MEGKKGVIAGRWVGDEEAGAHVPGNNFTHRILFR